jgi:hypothetical protein
MGNRETSDREKGAGKAKREGKVSFLEFVYLMSSQALIQMGEVPNPLSGKKEKNLPLAQHSIEVLSMIEEKTRGNLSDEEKQSIRDALYNLQMRYVEISEKDTAGGR